MLEVIRKDRISSFGRSNILEVEGNKGIKLPNGLYIKYPELRKEVDEEGNTETVYKSRRGRTLIDTRIYGGKVIENVCQALARIVIGEQLLRISQKYKVVMTVHDAVGCIVPEAEVEEGMRVVERIMRIRPRWAPDLPLDCEGGFGDSYGAC